MYCGDNFTIYTNNKSLCCTPKTNIVLYVNYTWKRNDGLRHAITWMKLENIMPSERGQSPKATYYDSTYMECPEHIEKERRWVAARLEGKMDGNTGFLGIWGFFGGWWKGSEIRQQWLKNLVNIQKPLNCSS